MAYFEITATYHYSGEIEADTAEDARAEFLDNLNMYFSHTFEELVSEMPVCETCDQHVETGCECEDCECKYCVS